MSTYFPLDSKVLAVAVIGEFGDWAAYIGAVAGKNHDIEMVEVARSGSKLPLNVAKLLFPNHAKNYKWRD